MSERRVVITGLGVVSPHGADAEEFFGRLTRGESAIRSVPSGREAVRADVLMAPATWVPDDHVSRLQQVVMDPVAQLGFVAARSALRDAGLLRVDGDELRPAESLADAGVYFGCGLGGSATFEDNMGRYFDLSRTARRAKPTIVPRVMPNAPAAHVSIEFGLHGPSHTYSVACTSSATAIGEAFRAIRDGYLECVVAGGAEAMLTDGILIAWEAMGVLATPHPDGPQAACRPFDSTRSGMALGEGAAVLILENEAHAKARGARILGRMLGYGTSSDAHNLTQPQREGQVRSMRAALDDAGIEARSVDYLNAHATGTTVGDGVEIAAIREVFGDAASSLPVSSTKSMHGHLVGAAGALELVVSLMALQRGVLPPTANLDVPDPECSGVDLVRGRARTAAEARVALSNSFGFGGANASLLIGRGDD